jgi:hypothetical protein
MKKLSVTFNDFIRSLYSPSNLYNEIKHGRKTSSWPLILGYGAFYTISCFWLAYNAASPIIQPWITLDPDIYYFVEGFYALPLIFLLWVMAAGTIYLLNKLLGGKGTFENLLNMTGYSIVSPWVILAVFDVIPNPDWLYDAVVVLCLVLTAYGTAVATKFEEETTWWQAWLTSGATLLAVGLIAFTFVR